MIICLKKTIFSSLSLATLLLFSGCAEDKLLLNTYAPPAQMDKVKELMEKTTSNKSYLDVYINDSNEDMKAILNGKTDDKSIAQMLLSKVKAKITETNFIGINENGDSNTISLEMKILSYNYATTQSSINAFLEVSFSFIQDGNSTPIYSPVYKKSVKRYSRSGKQGLPSKSEILSYMTNELATDLVMDISPTKSRKLVELKSLPDSIAYTINYAKMGNYKGAIQVMKDYKGEKTLAYYFDLAIYNEGLASSTSNIKLLSLVNKYYEKAMAMGGYKDEVVIKAKAKFDNFYNLIQAIDKQRKKNESVNLNRGDEIL